MTTNRDWLFSLPLEEQYAWMNAEHQERVLDGDTAALEAEYGKGGLVGGSFIDIPEQGEVVMPLESWREYLGTESENEDSRDKLEADVRKIAEAYNMDTQRHGTERFAHELYHSIIHLLDRQAAITEEKTRYKWVTASAEEIAAWRSKAEKLQAKVTELTAERNELQAQVDTLKSRHCPHYHVNEHTCDVHETRIAELTAERDKAREESVELYSDLVKASDERERYRSKFGKCIDYADAIHALMDDEGMA